MRKILIVDDARESCAALEMALEDAAPVVTVASAEEALRRLAEGGVAAVITDVQLPAMDGWQLVEAIRAGRSSLPVIVVSASPDPDAPAKARLAGANAYFAKPFSPLAVRRRLEELLEESIHAR